MEIVETVLNIAQAIYNKCNQIKCCEMQRQRLISRIQILLLPIETLQKESTKPLSPRLKVLLQRVLQILEKAEAGLVKYSQCPYVKKFLKAGNMQEELATTHEHLSDAVQGIFLQMQVEQTIQARCSSEILCHVNQDLEADRIAWEERLKKAKEIDSNSEKILEGREKKEKVERKILDKEITEIDKSLLTMTTCLMESEKFVLHKGEYHKFPVAIKVFKNSPTTNSGKVRDLFWKEIKAMKKFESPRILRLYGICIDESGPSPVYSIVMEYCEKGTLRDVLKEEPGLSWKIRLQMALHAATGLYRLHQTENKAQLLVCINSTKFFVAEGYYVKLSGFELSQTESSIRRKHKETAHKEVPASAYISPESLASVNHQYNLPSEIYSFGIVLWEIATGKMPFAGCTSEEIYEKVCKQHYQEPLGEDCPPDLQDIIIQCRDHDPSMRPTAKDIVDALLAITSMTTLAG
ncbi:mixed lineage kinase domain-like protein [Tiliqua scincoides]|uniref:mixed lineage kinase domain-like protein n=1 Tax=Tiliqua scincoides TaxID=71010 RepID=UPI003463210A